MTFVNPSALLWGLLAVPVVILYLRRIRLRREPVATDLLWERVFAEQPMRTAWQRWRWAVSLAVQLVVLGLIVMALADPQIPGPRRIVLIVDNSASMAATDAEPSRLAAAKQSAKRLIAEVRPCDRMAILSAGGAVAVRCSLTNDRTALNEALDGLDVPPGAGSTRVRAAVELARRMLGETRRGEIKVVTDGCFDEAAKLAEAGDVELIRVGRRTGNVAITRLAARRNLTDPVKCQVLVEVRNFSDESTQCTMSIEAALGGSLVTAAITLVPDARWQRVFEITAPEADRVTARLDCQDGWAEDDSASLDIPPPADGDTAVILPPGPLAGSELPLAEVSRHGENDLRVPDDVGVEAAAVAERRFGPPRWPWLASLGMLLLTLEWCLYQRRWIC